MKRLGGFVLARALAHAPAVRATEMADFLGIWEQVATNAGACPTCRITFREAGQGAVVVANNGWRADLPDLSAGGAADGSGRWRDDRGAAWVAGRPFTVSFRLETSGLLAMTMVVDAGSGRRPVVRGRYRRVWAGA